MTDEKIYSPVTIEDALFPQEPDGTTVVTTKDGGTGAQAFGAEKIPEQPLPIKRVATELLSSALNTKSKKILAEFTFTQSGSISIGQYENGVSGDIRITPNGITARNMAGDTTFALDADTGNAVFKGSVQSGSIITGEVNVGNNSVIIDGENKRIIINDGTNDRILLGFLENGF